MLRLAVFLATLLATSMAFGQECVSNDRQICVDKEDLERFVQLARERKCLDSTEPKFQVDSITVITDQEGRVFYTGADPDKPYKLHMDWCHYQVDGEGKVKLVAAMNEPPWWGFRLRAKAYLGYLPLRAFEDEAKVTDGIDAGFMLDFFYIEWFNVNVAAGFRSVGAGVGMDLTKNFGLYFGYAFGWQNPRHNGMGSFYFAF